MPETTTLTGQLFEKAKLEALLKRRLFFTEAFEIYRRSAHFKGDNRGLYDYGPPGCALQANIVNEWRRHFVIEENMMELDCPAITPAPVLETSGHVGHFSDLMCKDPVKGEFLRADHLVETVLETRLEVKELDPDVSREYREILAQIDNYDRNALAELIDEHDIRNPNGGGKVLPPEPFNLMFSTSIGPSAAVPAYLRPETAQGQFLNFRKLLDYNHGAVPFASACVGKAYRNEISPRSGLLRVREFLLAEIEHYVDPENGKKHDRFDSVADLEMPLLDQATQLSGRTAIQNKTIREAVESKMIDNETLGYFLGRSYLFLLKLGADKSKIRLRQHLANEMAHYACDCWDIELLTSSGWIECIGCADRSAYDLTAHSAYTGAALVVREALANPIEVEEWQITLDKKKLGPLFKQDAKKVEAAAASLTQETLARFALDLDEKQTISIATEELSDGAATAQLSSQLCTIKKIKIVKRMREYTPNVIEPTFGIGRILYSVLEHTYWQRADQASREILSLPIAVAPIKVVLASLSNRADLIGMTKKLSARLSQLGITNNIDISNVSIGRKYARNDELGTPLGITIDFDSLSDGSVTLRERDSTSQVRASEDDIVQAIRNLVEGTEAWKDVAERLPRFTMASNED